jgi:hypothetical protein
MTIVRLFFLGLAFALFGWGILAVASRIEYDRRRRHADKFGEEPKNAPLPAWVQFVRSWLKPQP